MLHLSFINKHYNCHKNYTKSNQIKTLLSYTSSPSQIIQACEWTTEESYLYLEMWAGGCNP